MKKLLTNENKLKIFVRFLKEYDYHKDNKDSLSIFIEKYDNYKNSPYHMWTDILYRIKKNIEYETLNNSLFGVWGTSIIDGIVLQENIRYEWCMFLYENNIYDNVIEGFEQLFNSIIPYMNPNLYKKLAKLLNKK